MTFGINTHQALIQLSSDSGSWQPCYICLGLPFMLRSFLVLQSPKWTVAKITANPMPCIQQSKETKRTSTKITKWFKLLLRLDVDKLPTLSPPSDRYGPVVLLCGRNGHLRDLPRTSRASPNCFQWRPSSSLGKQVGKWRSVSLQYGRKKDVYKSVNPTYISTLILNCTND